jgi:hypothetical protein
VVLQTLALHGGDPCVGMDPDAGGGVHAAIGRCGGRCAWRRRLGAGHCAGAERSDGNRAPQSARKRRAHAHAFCATEHAAVAAWFAFAIATLIRASSGTPFLTAVISARIEIAISGGVRLPM